MRLCMLICTYFVVEDNIAHAYFHSLLVSRQYF